GELERPKALDPRDHCAGGVLPAADASAELWMGNHARQESLRRSSTIRFASLKKPTPIWTQFRGLEWSRICPVSRRRWGAPSPAGAIGSTKPHRRSRFD